MRKKKIDRSAVFQSIRGAAEISGLSANFIRDGCKNGSIPHILVGADYRVNVPLWLQQMNAASLSCKGAGTCAE